MAIIGILAALATVNFLRAQTRAKVVRAKADMINIATALEMYYVDFNNYPPEDPNLISGIGMYVSYLRRLVPLSTPVDYIYRVPIDKLNKTGDPIVGAFPSGYAYMVEDKWIGEDWTSFGRDQLHYGYKYFLHGSGPDCMNVCDYIDYGKAMPYPKPYDPTNGTISDGQIICIGPGNKMYP